MTMKTRAGASLAVLGLLAATACTTDDPADGPDPAGSPDTTAATGITTMPETATNGAADAADAIPFVEVEANNSPDSCWAVIEDSVYDLTEWIDQHPGGADRIEMLCGTDATDQFMRQHSGDELPQSRVTEFEIGTLQR